MFCWIKPFTISTCHVYSFRVNAVKYHFQVEVEAKETELEEAEGMEIEPKETETSKKPVLDRGDPKAARVKARIEVMRKNIDAMRENLEASMKKLEELEMERERDCL